MADILRVVKLASVLAGLSVLAACGGGSGPGGLDPTPVSSESFSPAEAVTDQGVEAALLWWKYRINGGNPVDADLDGIEISATFQDFLLTIDPNALVRKASLLRRTEIRDFLMISQALAGRSPLTTSWKGRSARATSTLPTAAPCWPTSAISRPPSGTSCNRCGRADGSCARNPTTARWKPAIPSGARW